MNSKGIDVSSHNGLIDWAKVKADGIQFAIIRAGYGQSATQEDKYFKVNYEGAKAAGLIVGAYWYSYATDIAGAVREAKACLQVLNKRDLDLPLFFDQEYEPGIMALTKEQRTAIINEFCAEIKRNSSYKVGLYSSTDFLKNWLNDDDIPADIARWVAQWSQKLTYAGTTFMWQTGATGDVGGINGDVDTDIFFGDVTAIGVNPTIRKTVAELAQEVLDGKWSNSDRRKELLTAAGYDYAEVQAEVNRMLNIKTKTPAELAVEVWDGKWGVGDERKRALTAAGYNYAAVQVEVNKLAKTMKNKKSNEEIAQEVLAGKWGSGETRKIMLTNAGYNYTAVQAIVNKLVK